MFVRDFIDLQNSSTGDLTSDQLKHITGISITSLTGQPPWHTPIQTNQYQLLKQHYELNIIGQDTIQHVTKRGNCF